MRYFLTMKMKGNKTMVNKIMEMNKLSKKEVKMCRTTNNNKVNKIRLKKNKSNKRNKMKRNLRRKNKRRAMNKEKCEMISIVHIFIVSI